jgi:hypothetical protein
VPGAAAGQAELVAGDHHPLELGGGVQHRLQDLAPLALGAGSLGEGPPGFGDPAGQLVAQALGLAEVEDPRLRGDGLHPMADLDPPEALRQQAGQLALQARDLPPQLEARLQLVDGAAELRETVSYEQVGHRPPLESRSSSAAGKAHSVKPSARLERRRGHPQGLLDRDLRHALDLDGDDRDPAAVRVHPVALGARAE